MKKRLLGLVLASSVLMLAACGSSEENAKKVEDPKTGSVEKKEKDTSTGLDKLSGDITKISEDDWKKIHLSKSKFKTFLAGMEKPNDDGEITINKASLVNDTRIEITLNNSDGDTLENSMTAPLLDAIIRQLYTHSDYYKKTQPTILFKDLSGYKITENSKPIEFDEGQSSTKDLGTFKFGEKVDVNGEVITINNSSFTNDRNEFDENKPEKVLKIDLTVQNSKQEEIFADASDFEVYDAAGTKMEIYSLDNFSETLQAGKNASGSIFFGVTSKGPYELYFNDMATGSKAKWIVNVQ